MLTADELGKKGELRFDEICIDAKLICNPSTYDRAGWDRIVEFRFEPTGQGSTLDKRGSPISCHVQVKTMWDSSDEFRMRLSSAERLAKEPKPAFVYVFKVNPKLEFVEAYLVHMLDDNLAAVLLRLRREHAKGALAVASINRRVIAFRASRAGLRLEPTGKALRDALAMLCGPDPNAYIEKKRAQMHTLGFDTDRFEAKTTFVLEEGVELIDVLLGLQKAELTEFKSFETRFGITLPMDDTEFVSGTLHIQPEAADRCTITVRETALSPPAVFAGEVFFPPLADLPREQWKAMIKSKLFTIMMRGQEINISTNASAISTEALKIADWIAFEGRFPPSPKATGRSHHYADQASAGVHTDHLHDDGSRRSGRIRAAGPGS